MPGGQVPEAQAHTRPGQDRPLPPLPLAKDRCAAIPTANRRQGDANPRRTASIRWRSSPRSSTLTRHFRASESDALPRDHRQQQSPTGSIPLAQFRQLQAADQRFWFESWPNASNTNRCSIRTMLRATRPLGYRSRTPWSTDPLDRGRPHLPAASCRHVPGTEAERQAIVASLRGRRAARRQGRPVPLPAGSAFPPIWPDTTKRRSKQCKQIGKWPFPTRHRQG